MVIRQELQSFLDALLQAPPECRDPSNNGLQVEGATHVKHVVFGVDACDALFAQAEKLQAQFVVVHHGLSWGNGFRTLTGPLAVRLRRLFRADISLYASHLPLDAHPELGNNAVIARRLGLQHCSPFCLYGGIPIGLAGNLATPLSLADLQAVVCTELDADAQLWPASLAATATVQRLGIVSGGGADAVDQCAQAGVQCLVTGEMGHVHYHPALEANMPIIAAGHYATETTGIKALLAEVERRFDVTCTFVDLPTDL